MNLFKKVVSHKIVSFEQLFLSRVLELDDYEVDMWELKNNKSPCLDGLLVEFYQGNVACGRPCILENV